MHILRAMARGMNKITFVLFAFVLSLVITIATPRPTYAEGPLLGTVRCLLETVLLQRCKPQTQPPSNPSVTPAPQPTPSKGGEAPASPSTNKPAQPASPNTPTRGAQTTPAASTSPSLEAAQEVEIAVPKETAEMAPAVKGAVAPHAPGASLTDADYMTFFNTYSKYARDAQPQQVGAAPLETSSEGWKVLGVAWYWWAVLGLLGVAIFTSIKSYALRKSS